MTMPANDITSSEDDPAVTVCVMRRLHPRTAAEFATLLQEVKTVAGSFPGYLGTDVVQGTGPEPWALVTFRFDHRSHLQRWKDSPLLHEWLRRAEALTLGSPSVRTLEGLDMCFAFPEDGQTRIPPRYKMAILTWLAAFPLATLLVVVLQPILAGTWAVFHTMAVSAILVPLLIFIVIPRIGLHPVW